MSISVSIGAPNEAVSVISGGFTVTPVHGIEVILSTTWLCLFSVRLYYHCLCTKYTNNASVCVCAHQCVRRCVCIRVSEFSICIDVYRVTHNVMHCIFSLANPNTSSYN